MSIDRDSYEPITGNPRRERDAPEKSGEETSSGSTSDGKVDGTAGSPNGPDGDPSGASPSSGGDSPSERKQKKQRTTGGRKRRVKVTPKDWDQLQHVAEELGVGYATAYRIAFQQLVRQLEEQESIS